MLNQNTFWLTSRTRGVDGVGKVIKPYFAELIAGADRL
jgi:hypothetical protein